MKMTSGVKTNILVAVTVPWNRTRIAAVVVEVATGFQIEGLIDKKSPAKPVRFFLNTNGSNPSGYRCQTLF
jgi:hypothetical protein